MKTAVRVAGLCVLLTLSFFFIGCSAATSTRPVSVGATSSTTAIDQGQGANITATVSNDSKNGGVTWTLTGAGALSGQTTTSVTYTAPSTVTTVFTATITATSVSDASKTASVTVQVNPNPAVTTTSVQAATAGTSYSATISMSGGTSPFTWSLSSGTLPAGITMGSSTSSSVTVSGTPTGGNSTFTVKVKDSANPPMTSSQQLTITVNPPAALAITTSSLANGIASTTYNQTLAATGGVGPDTWSISTGSLPAGLTLNASTGAITGTPTTAGTFSFTAKVTDSETPTPVSATANLAIVIVPVLQVQTSSLPQGVANIVYSGATLQATGGVTPYTWSISSGSLPAGLILNTSTGAITGTPTAAGTFNFTAKVIDSGTPQQSATANLSIKVDGPLAITTTSLATAVVGASYNQSVAASGGVTPYTWSLSASTLPPGLSLNTSTGAITGTPTTAGPYSFTVKVTDSETSPQSVTANLSITVNPQLAITTTSLSTGVLNIAYNQSLAATGGITPYTWSISTGSLPPGLSLNASTGAITGTPTTAGSYSFTAKVTDSESPTQSVTANLSLTINAKLGVQTTTLPQGVVNTTYSGATLQAVGGVTPYTWSWTGTTPPGLALSGAGAISGTPTTAGTYNFTVQVMDSSTPQQTATANLSLTVNAQLTITTTTLSNGVVGTAYSQTMAAAGGIKPYTWSISVGSLPAGLSLNTSTGAITGTPTTAGTVNFTAKVTDSESPTQSATANLSITIIATLQVQTSGSLPPGVVSTAYSGTTLQATGGVMPYTWSISTGNLPAGLTLNTSTGAISGTPTTAGTFNFTAKVVDAGNPQQSATANLSMTIDGPLTITTTSLPTAVVGTSYSQTLAATGGITPYAWSLNTGNLPPGLSLNTSTGAITGTPTTAGPYSFTVKVTDSEGSPQSVTASLSITVNAQLAITTSTLSSGVLNVAYSQTLAATGGITPYTWSISTGSLPPGLSLNTNTGAITGTPTTAGSYSFTAKVTDSESPKQSATASLSITINTKLAVQTTTLPPGVVTTTYSGATLQATGGVTSYTWSWTGTTPPGLALSSAGAISGTPTTAGTYNFTVQVMDSSTPQQTATANLSLTVNAQLAITTTTFNNGVVGTSYSQALAATGGITPYTWSISVGSLPAGLSLNTSTGAITGTPTAAGTVNFTAKVTDSESPNQSVTASLSLTINAKLVIQTSSLPQGVVNATYSGATLQAVGGVTPYVWSISTGNLPGGLVLNSSTGAITGTPTATGTFNFTAKVVDAGTPQQSATANLSIKVNGVLTITTASLPSGVLNQSYNQSVAATGGLTPYTWSISAGSLPTGLSLNASTGAITGTPTATGTSNFTVQVVDSETPTAQTSKALSITINNSTPLQITTSGMPGGVINTAYSNAFLGASGGTPPYAWSITAGSLPPGLSLTSSTGQVSGTPTSTGTFNFTAKVVDQSVPQESATANLSITINAGLTITTTSLPGGSINTSYNQSISASGGVTPYSWTITSGSLPPGLSYGTNNNAMQISGTPTSTGSYTFTAQVTDSEGSPASVSQSYTINITNQPAGYTVSGTVSYSGSKTGFVYLQLVNTNCQGCNSNPGTSISDTTLKAGGAFTIHGVPAGTYSLQAFMDNIGYGAENASNPTGTSSGNINVTGNKTGVSVTLGDPAAVNLSGTAPSWRGNNGVGAFSGGAFVSFQTIQNNNGIEMPASYTVEWSTSSSFGSIAGSKSFAGTGHSDPLVVNGLSNGTTYYFRAQGVAGSSTSNWSAASPGILIDPSSTGNAVSGKVTFSGTAKGPLYVGFYDQNTGNIYVDVVGSESSPPTNPASYSLDVPTGSNYYFFGFIDNNNSGMFSGPGQISNVNENNMASVAITGPTSNENLTLPSANSQAQVMTQANEQINSNGTSTGYGVGVNVNGLFKQPVAVEITNAPSPGIVFPVDIATGAFNGNHDEFSFWPSLNGATPNVGDSYTLKVTYSDGTTDTFTPQVTAVLNNAFVTDPAPQGTSVSTTPNFSWTDPANASNYTYEFWLCCDQNNNTIWQIPGNNSNSNGFSSSITSITWNVDPTNSGDLPDVSSLNGGTYYSWQIQASDVNGNSAQVQVNFQTVSTPLQLPAANPSSLGTATVGQSYNGTITASGGYEPYSYLVTGSSCYGCNPVTLSDGLSVTDAHDNTLVVGGTPTGTGTVTFQVWVQDNTGATAGPVTYTITVSAASALTIETTSLPGGNKNWTYSTYLNANGGSGNYTWSVISGGLPAGLSFDSNNSGMLTGTPTATGTSNFTVQVSDGTGATASQALSIVITSCTYTALNGNYAFLVNGWKGTSEIQATVGSFVANGAGNITSGEMDINDQNKGPQTITLSGGTYCVSANNLALINITSSGGSGTFAATLDSTGNGHITRYDGTSSEVSAGLLRKQTTSAFSTSKLIGNYALGFVGVDGGSDSRFAMAGEFASSSGSGGDNNLSGEVDYDSGGSGQGSGPGNTTLSASNFQVGSSTTGRGTVSINFTGPGATLNFVFYVVSASEMLFMDDDTYGSGDGNPLIAGQVLQQSGTFTDASLDGVGVIEAQVLDANNTPATADAEAGLVTTNGTGSSFSVTTDENDGGTMTYSETASGTYSVASNGRVTVTLTGENHPPVLYLVAKNQAFVIGTNGNKVNIGTLTPQTGSSFTNASLSGNYLGGSQQPVTYDVSSELDAVSANGAGTFNVTSDKNGINCGNGNACPETGVISGLNYSVSGNGRVIVTCGSGSGPNCSPAGTQVGIMYIISTSQVVFLPVQDGHPYLTDFQK